MQLVGGRNEYEGRVEICQRGSWGTVCDDRWDDTDAMVVCRQLGISTSGKPCNQHCFDMMYMLVTIHTYNDVCLFAQLADAIATTQSSFINEIIGSNFGRGTGPIFLDELGCRGNETALDVCPHRGTGIHNCNHGEDAGVICSQQGNQSHLSCNHTNHLFYVLQ